jgi:hypothetical protein
MFYRWFLKFFSKTDIHKDFLKWVGEQPANDVYEYNNPFNCAFACFLKSQGKTQVSVGPNTYLYKEGDNRISKIMPDYIDDAVHEHPRTFGALYGRLK